MNIGIKKQRIISHRMEELTLQLNLMLARASVTTTLKTSVTLSTIKDMITALNHIHDQLR